MVLRQTNMASGFDSELQSALLMMAASVSPERETRSQYVRVTPVSAISAGESPKFSKSQSIPMNGSFH